MDSSYRPVITNPKAYKLGTFPPSRHDGVDVLKKDGYQACNSEGVPFEIPILWHLELNPLRHAYLARYNYIVQFHLRDFKKVKTMTGVEVLRPCEKGVTLDQLQTRDLLDIIWPAHATVTRNKRIQVNI
jgi:hypothetical protein